MKVDGLVGEGGVLALLLVAGGLIALAGRSTVSWRWLFIAACLSLLNDALLTRGYGLIPSVLPHADWNWQGKATALAATLLVAAAPPSAGGGAA